MLAPWASRRSSALVLASGNDAALMVDVARQ